jgi:hypothetical protein
MSETMNTALTVPWADVTISAATGVKVSRVGMTFPANMTFEDWSAVGIQLERLADATRWLFADWLNYGAHHYGDGYAKLAAQVGLSEQAVKDLKWVGGKVELSRRRDDLYFGHHREVAPLPPEEQTKWLARAKEKGWSVHRLREKIALSEDAVRTVAAEAAEASKKTSRPRTIPARNGTLSLAPATVGPEARAPTIGGEGEHPEVEQEEEDEPSWEDDALREIVERMKNLDGAYLSHLGCGALADITQQAARLLEEYRVAQEGDDSE